SREPVDPERLSAFMEGLLARFGDALLRYKGVLAVANEPRRLVFQGVLRLYSFDWDAQWAADEVRESVLVFIGDDLPEDEIRQGFAEVLGRAGSGLFTEGGKFPLQQSLVAQVEFDQAAQVADRVQVDMVADEAEIAGLGAGQQDFHLHPCLVTELDLRLE